PVQIKLKYPNLGKAERECTDDKRVTATLEVTTPTLLAQTCPSCTTPLSCEDLLNYEIPNFQD
ncbi:MAG: hypothetical protein J7L73_00280, partial [Anaerolineales bacterium]|nr:hypothetical protein [Anaerolineales bacterium]